MGLVEHAENEMKLAGWLDTDDDMQKSIVRHIRRMVKEFADEGHSGSSAAYTLSVLKRLLNYEPLTALTGEKWEWAEPFNDDGSQQNVRMSNIFRDKDGQAYRIDGIIFRNQDGCTFTCDKSFVPISFPYTPKGPTVVDVYERPED